jgi:hypothetical protein
MSNNQWDRPTAPPSPLFVNQRERDFVKQIADEVQERIVGQQVAYYPLDLEITNYHSVYGEAIEKNFLPPVRVYALIEWEGMTTNVTSYADAEQNIMVHFHKRRLTEDQDLFVRLGDFVAYGDSFYEIVELHEKRQLFGNIDYKFEISATCVRAREGLFDAS